MRLNQTSCYLPSFLLLLSSTTTLAGGDGTVALREPIGIVVLNNHIAVANRTTGTISLIDAQSSAVVHERKVAGRIADAVAISDEAVCVVDDSSNRLVLVKLVGSSIEHIELASIPERPSKIAYDRRSRQLFVSCRWSHQLISLKLDDSSMGITGSRSLKLKFAPHSLLTLPSKHITVVADAFAGKLAVVDSNQFMLLRMHAIDGHNIRGLALSSDGRRLHVALQQFVPEALADYEELHWGRMMSNAVQTFDVADLMKGEQLLGWQADYGGIGSAMGDPSAVISGTKQFSAVAFGGVGEVALRRDGVDKRIKVGERPQAMVLRGDRLFVANRYGDSVSVVDTQLGKVLKTISLGPSPELNSVQRGERLFFNARLSHDGWLSCHSCHTDGHSAGLLVDTLGDGDYGAPKRIPSLLGTAGTGPWGWTGEAKSLSEQIQKSVTTTMHGDELTKQQASDLVAYLRTLKAPPALRTLDSSIVQRGQELFQSQNCANCHSGTKFTSPTTYDVGFQDANQRRLFNPPSLRGVSQRPNLFHDGRAKSIEEVVNRFRHQLSRTLDATDSKALIAYINSL